MTPNKERPGTSDLSSGFEWQTSTSQSDYTDETPPFRPQISNFSPVSFIGALSLTEGASLVIHTWIRNIFRTHRRLLDLMSVGGAFFPQAVYLWYVRYFRFYERYLRENLIWARKLETNLDQPKSNMTTPMHRGRTRAKTSWKACEKISFPSSLKANDQKAALPNRIKSVQYHI